jgi:hypothetical protein
MLPVYFIHFGELPLDLQKVIISIADPHPTILSLVSKFFNEWAIPLKVTFYSNGKCKSIDPFPREELLKISKTLTTLAFYCCSTIINDDFLKSFVNLTELDLIWNNAITDEGIRCLTNLKSLKLSGDKTISDECISKMSHLRSLTISFDCHNYHTNDAISELTNLTVLDVQRSFFTDEGLLKLTNLTWLNVKNTSITDNSISRLTNLTHLEPATRPSVDCLKCLTKLRYCSF